MNDTTQPTSTDERCAMLADEAFRCATLCQFRADIEPWMADEAAEFADRIIALRTQQAGGAL